MSKSLWKIRRALLTNSKEYDKNISATDYTVIKLSVYLINAAGPVHGTVYRVRRIQKCRHKLR